MKVVLGLAAGLCILSVVQATFSGDYYRFGKRGLFDLHDYDDSYRGIGRSDLYKYGSNKYGSLNLYGLGDILGKYHKGGFGGYRDGHYDDYFYKGNGIGFGKLLDYFGVDNGYELLKYYGIDFRKYLGNDYHGDGYHGDDYYGDDYHGDGYYGKKKYGDGYYGKKHGDGYYGKKHGDYYGRGKGGHYGGRRYGNRYGGLLGSLKKYLGGGRNRYYGRGGKGSSLY